MTKETKVKIELTVRQAAAIRQILYEHQKEYSYKHVPERITDVRGVIQSIDDNLSAIIDPWKFFFI